MSFMSEVPMDVKKATGMCAHGNFSDACRSCRIDRQEENNRKDLPSIDIKKEALRYASELHNRWRASRKEIEGTAIDGLPKREERWKPIDPKNSDGPKVDIANTPFDQLPPAWQSENYLAAETEIKIVDSLDKKLSGVVDLEEASAQTHVEWKKRNPWASGEQAGLYSDLSSTEKDKDRVVVEGAVEDISEQGHPIRLVNKGWAIGERLERELAEKKRELQLLDNGKLTRASTELRNRKKHLQQEIRVLDMNLAHHKIGRHMDSPYESFDPANRGTEGAKPDLPTSDPGGEDRYGYLDGESREDKERRKMVGV